MKNIKVGNLVYHYMQMGRVGTVVEVKKSKSKVTWMTEGTPSVHMVAVVQYPDGTTSEFELGELFRADRE
jgi:hypothetical protein